MNHRPITKLPSLAEDEEQSLQPTFLLQDPLPLEGKVALVIRSDSSIIGCEVAMKLVEQGCGTIILHYSLPERSMKELSKKLSARGARCIRLCSDLRCEDQIIRLFHEALEEAKVLDIVVSISNQAENVSLFNICDQDLQTGFAALREQVFVAKQTFFYIKPYGRLIFIHSGADRQRSGNDILRYRARLFLSSHRKLATPLTCSPSTTLRGAIEALTVTLPDDFKCKKCTVNVFSTKSQICDGMLDSMTPRRNQYGCTVRSETSSAVALLASDPGQVLNGKCESIQYL